MGILSFLDGGGDDAAQELNKRMLQDARDLPLPVLKEYYPELYKSVVAMNPELESAVELGPSEMAGISTDPALRQNRLNALKRLKEIGAAGGRDSQFMSEYGQLESDVNTNLQGQQGAISQNLATRGLSGGGSELVAKNIAAQGAANRHSQSAMDLKAAADKRALQALMQTGELSGQMEHDDFNRDAAKAEAADSISRFNAQNKQNVIGTNVAAKNNAQMYNAENNQTIADKNTGVQNDAQIRNNNLTQEQYENELKKRGLIRDSASGLADSYSREAAGNRQVIGGLIQAGAGAYGRAK